jgi:hypothetical protein
VALLIVGVTLWVPFSTTCRMCNYVPLGAAMAAPLVVALASLGVLLYVPLRGRGRIGSPIGRPYWRDLLLTPLLAGPGLGASSSVIAGVIGERRDAALALAFLSGLALAVPLALAALAVALKQG